MSDQQFRDMCAAFVLIAVYREGVGLGQTQEEMAREAYLLADAMLDARSRRNFGSMVKGLSSIRAKGRKSKKGGDK